MELDGRSDADKMADAMEAAGFTGSSWRKQLNPRRKIIKEKRDNLAENLLMAMAQRVRIEEDLEAVAKRALAAAEVIYPPQEGG